MKLCEAYGWQYREGSWHKINCQEKAATSLGNMPLCMFHAKKLLGFYVEAKEA